MRAVEVQTNLLALAGTDVDEAAHTHHGSRLISADVAPPNPLMPRRYANERHHRGDARVAGRGRARPMSAPNDGSCGGQVAAGTCTGGVGFASVSALTRGWLPPPVVSAAQASASVLGPRCCVSSLDGFDEAIRIDRREMAGRRVRDSWREAPGARIPRRSQGPGSAAP